MAIMLFADEAVPSLCDPVRNFLVVVCSQSVSLEETIFDLFEGSVETDEEFSEVNCRFFEIWFLYGCVWPGCGIPGVPFEF